VFRALPRGVNRAPGGTQESALTTRSGRAAGALRLSRWAPRNGKSRPLLELVPEIDSSNALALEIQNKQGVTADLSIHGVDQSYSNHGQPQMQITNPDLKSVRYLRLVRALIRGRTCP
jgi:hypothetical protein